MREQHSLHQRYQTRSLLQRWATEECRYWRKEAKENKPETVPLIDGKVHHIQDVIDETVLLIDGMGGMIEETQIPWNVPMAIAVAQVHDVKRFYEGYQYGKYNKTGYNHPREGAVKFLQDYYSGKFTGMYDVFRKEGVDPLVVYYGALHHGENIYQSYENLSEGKQHPGSASPFLYDAYGWLIRDADKMANVLEVDHSISVCKRERKDLPSLSPKIEENLIRNESVSYKHVETGIDGLAAMMGWWSDIRYRATKEHWMNNHIFEQYLAQMHIWGLHGDQFMRVHDAFEQSAQEEGFALDAGVLQQQIEKRLSERDGA